METYPLHNKEGAVYAFEIPHSYFPTAGSVARFLAKCPGVVIVKVRRFAEFNNEIHAEFQLNGISFVVWEPFGDNSRLWVGPKAEPAARVSAIDTLVDFARSHWPGPISRARGQILAGVRRAIGI